MQRRTFLGTAALAALGAKLPAPAWARQYPSRPINYIVAYTPGSANDILVRLIAPKLDKFLNGTVVVINKPGAGGSVGMAALAQAPADGYSLGLGSNATMAINQAMFDNLSYHPIADFYGVAKIATSPNVVVVPAKSRIRTIGELIELLPKEPLLYSSPGNGTTQHLAGAMLKNRTSGVCEHVPYKGPAEAIAALISGDQADYGFASLPSVLAQVKAGQLRALAVTPAQRTEFLPDVPTLASAGLADFEKTDLWFGMVVRKQTPEPIIKQLHDATLKTLLDPAVQASLAKGGYVPAGQEPLGRFEQFLEEQARFWAGLVNQSGAKIG